MAAPILSPGPSGSVGAVTPSNTVDFPGGFRSLWVGGAGNISLDDMDGNTAVLFSGIPAGTILPVAGKRVRLTNTTATLIVGLR